MSLTGPVNFEHLLYTRVTVEGVSSLVPLVVDERRPDDTSDPTIILGNSALQPLGFQLITGLGSLLVPTPPDNVVIDPVQIFDGSRTSPPGPIPGRQTLPFLPSTIRPSHLPRSTSCPRSEPLRQPALPSSTLERMGSLMG